MNAEIRAKVDRLAVVYENRVLVVTVLVALIVSACLSYFIIRGLAGEKFDPAAGDRAVITYEVTYYDHPVTVVVAWIDKNGVTHFAKETPKLAGFEMPILAVILLNLGLAKACYDIYGFLTGRYRRRLTAMFQYRLHPDKP